MGSNVHLLIRGHAALAACFVLYLFWWWVFFYPRIEKPMGLLRGAGVASIAGAGICGIVGVVICLSALSAMQSKACIVQPWQIAVGGVIAYLVLLFITSSLFKRQVTSELIIMTAWSTLELVVLDQLLGSGVLGSGAVTALAIVLVVLFAVSIVCYLRFYHLAPQAAFVCGAIPLVLGISYALVIVLTLMAR